MNRDPLYLLAYVVVFIILVAVLFRVLDHV